MSSGNPRLWCPGIPGRDGTKASQTPGQLIPGSQEQQAETAGTDTNLRWQARCIQMGEPHGGPGRQDEQGYSVAKARSSSGAGQPQPGLQQGRESGFWGPGVVSSRKKERPKRKKQQLLSLQLLSPDAPSELTPHPGVDKGVARPAPLPFLSFLSTAICPLATCIWEKIPLTGKN